MDLRILREPEEYFRDRVKYPRLRMQVMVVLLAGIAITLWRPSLYYFWSGSAQYITDPILMLTFGEITAVLLLWLILGLIWHYMAQFFGGDSNYGRMLRTTGYGFFPIIIAGLIWSAGYAYTLSNAPNPPQPPQLAGMQSAGFQHYYAQYEDFVGQVHDDPIILVAIGIGSLFVLWAGYLWQRAVMVSGDTNEKVAGAAALLGMSVFLLWAFMPFI